MRRLMFAAIACAVTVNLQPAQTLGRPGLTPVPCPVQNWEIVDPEVAALPGAQLFTGRYDGGVYQIEVPEKWNGELVLSAHGYVANTGANGSRLRVNPPQIRQHLIDRGFAWAASSYRCNGYVPGVALLDTMALTRLFTELNSGTAPRRVYLTGASMGGHVTILGMQEFPTAFDGGLAMCPAGPDLFDFFAATAAAAEAITGTKFDDLATVPQALKQINEALGTPPNLTDKGRELADIQIALSGGPRPFVVEGLGGRFAPNIDTGAHALAGDDAAVARAADTTRIHYPDALDRTVRRKTGDSQLRQASGPYDEVVAFDGRIDRPLLTMHGTGDMYVPIHLEQILRRAVEAAGRQNLLVQRIYRIAGHCGFNADEQSRSFDDLVTWVRGGTKPDGDNVFGDLTNAGMAFTNPLRKDDPGTLRTAPPSQP